MEICFASKRKMGLKMRNGSYRSRVSLRVRTPSAVTSL